jgi:hypothetical protein
MEFPAYVVVPQTPTTPPHFAHHQDLSTKEGNSTDVKATAYLGEDGSEAQAVMLSPQLEERDRMCKIAFRIFTRCPIHIGT